ncbi:MAG: phosphate ABC transporter permease subunit PstC [Alkaliphilus sp.]|nr:phosphate ABC transporter permease subunit PstC [bacterium AH-315-E09]PHS36157.1 MAG: phosphate ABC transporter permease subunit PstC [Alkaliphilus sp.]
MGDTEKAIYSKTTISHRKDLTRSSRFGEFLIEKTIFSIGITAILILGLIFYYLVSTGLNVFATVSISEFFTTTGWFPVSSNAKYGTVPLVVGSLMVTMGAILISVPIGIGSAIYISEVAPAKARTVLKVIIEFLSAVPSVVLGFLGIVVLSNWVRITLSIPTGFTAFTGAILVSLMALPTIISISDDAIAAVPKDYRDASLALGATKWETIRYVLVPAASSGITAAVMLGVGRAIGETMAVLMVTGNAAQIPDTMFTSVRTMTATIAAEMGDTVRNDTHYFALFAIGSMLLFMTTVINTIADYVVTRGKKEGR